MLKSSILKKGLESRVTAFVDNSCKPEATSKIFSSFEKHADMTISNISKFNEPV